MTSAEFLDRCRRHLSPDDYRLVAAAVLTSPPEGAPAGTGSSSLLGHYYSWERALRNELVRLRARRLERPSDPWLRPAPHDEGASRAAQAAFQAASPLDAELLLERQRWSHIQGLKALHIFDLESIAAYRLELQIIERLAHFHEERGEARYRETYSAILGSAHSTGVQQ
jgi:hypothetical protein